ncbi:MAG TPA: hypothetical protein DD490_03620, partial [Acidobacteria bacterium]|nr:hypothetical protein [Acidobacteriota bacterium]
LWASDGTAAGTRRIATLPNEAATLSSAGSWALLSFHTSRRVWRTDGTTAGTREIPLPAGIRTFGNATGASLGNVTFFRASSGFGAEIWRTDGTAAGTWPVTGAETAALGEMATHGGALFFLAGTPENPSRLALWRSTGAPGGTQRLRTFGAFGGFSSPAPAELTSLGSLLFFRLDDGESGSELWRTDGTAAGTVQVHDIAPGEDGSFPMELTALGSRLYFAAREAEHGIELWETDGTAEGTRLVQDIAPGAFSSNPQELTAGGGGRLFFTADDGLHGREPWVYSPEGASCVPAATVLCLSAGRFKVEVDWRTGLRDGGRGHATALTPDTGTFWFFDAANVEVIVKVLDGRSLNGHHWVFFGALSNVEYAVTVTDTLTGAARRYTNLPGRLGSVADTQAFGPLGASLAGVVTEGPAPEVGEVPLVASRSVHATGSCTPGPARLCLNGGRFAVEARWKDFQGHTGAGKAVPLSGGDTGYFWFFDAGNVEVVLKVLDGRPLNGKFWVFYGA